MRDHWPRVGTRGLVFLLRGCSVAGACKMAAVGLVLLAGLTACSQAGKSNHVLEPDSLIVPGKRIGSVALGMSLEQLTAVVGQPVVAYDSDNTRFAYPDARLSGILVPGTGVLWIDYGSLQQPQMASVAHTADGIHLGSGRLEVIRAYGPPPTAQEGEMNYPALGLAFTLRNDRVARISVYTPEAGK